MYSNSLSRSGPDSTARRPPCAGVHRIVREPVGSLVSLARDPRVRHVAGPERRGEAGRFAHERPQIRVFDLPATRHLLDDEARIHAHLDEGIRVDLLGLTQSGQQAAVFGEIVRGGTQELRCLTQHLAGRSVADDGTVACGTGVVA